MPSRKKRGTIQQAFGVADAGLAHIPSNTVDWVNRLTGWDRALKAMGRSPSMYQDAKANYAAAPSELKAMLEKPNPSFGPVAAAATLPFAATKAIKNVGKSTKPAPLFTRANPDPLKKGSRQRVSKPGIYKSPTELAADVRPMVANEDPMLKQLFGVDRGDMFEMQKRGKLKGGAKLEDIVPFKKNARGNENMRSIMTPANAERLVNAIKGFKKGSPDLYRGMVPWYEMRPLYEKFVAMHGPELGAKKFAEFNNATAMHSPMSDVLTEYNRGSHALRMANEGRMAEYLKYGGKPKLDAAGNLNPGIPEDMRNILGHPAHSTSQAPPFAKYMAEGSAGMKSPKVPAYIGASSVDDPAQGLFRQSTGAVPDAHLTRAIGLPDVRTSNDYNVSMKLPEYQSFHKWWRDDVAKPAGLEAVPAQAVAWGGYGPQTGVQTTVAAPKLELLSQQIAKAAKREGVSPETMRDRMIAGKAGVGAVVGGALLSQPQSEQDKFMEKLKRTGIY